MHIELKLYICVYIYIIAYINSRKNRGTCRAGGEDGVTRS